jgi:hypothetical protein
MVVVVVVPRQFEPIHMMLLALSFCLSVYLDLSICLFNQRKRIRSFGLR